MDLLRFVRISCFSTYSSVKVAVVWNIKCIGAAVLTSLIVTYYMGLSDYPLIISLYIICVRIISENRKIVFFYLRSATRSDGNQTKALDKINRNWSVRELEIQYGIECCDSVLGKRALIAKIFLFSSVICHKQGIVMTDDSTSDKYYFEDREEPIILRKG